jgi:hypothetical protein
MKARTFIHGSKGHMLLHIPTIVEILMPERLLKSHIHLSNDMLSLHILSIYLPIFDFFLFGEITGSVTSPPSTFSTPSISMPALPPNESAFDERSFLLFFW